MLSSSTVKFCEYIGKTVADVPTSPTLLNLPVDNGITSPSLLLL